MKVTHEALESMNPLMHDEVPQQSRKKRFAQSHHELDVYQRAMEAAMVIFENSKSIPKEEMDSLTDQVRRSSRSVCANLAEAWRKRRYEAAFISKLSDSEAEAAESQVWLEFAVKCGYRSADTGRDLFTRYDSVIRTIVGMITHPEPWVIKR